MGRHREVRRCAKRHLSCGFASPRGCRMLRFPEACRLCFTPCALVVIPSVADGPARVGVAKPATRPRELSSVLLLLLVVIPSRFALPRDACRGIPLRVQNLPQRNYAMWVPHPERFSKGRSFTQCATNTPATTKSPRQHRLNFFGGRGLASGSAALAVTKRRGAPPLAAPIPRVVSASCPRLPQSSPRRKLPPQRQESPERST